METNNFKDPKTQVWGVLTAFLALMCILVVVGIAYAGQSFFKNLGGVEASKTFPVTAEGKVKAVPDVATINLGVISRGNTAKLAQGESVNAINKITSFVKQQGVADEDITTSNSSLNPVYNWQDGKSEITGYESNQTITVKVRNVDTDEGQNKASNIMAGAVENGATSIYGSTYTIDNPDGLRQEARLKAIETAKEKAKELSAAAGIKLGKVVNVTESGGYYPPMPLYADKAVMAEGIGGGGYSPTVEPGQQDVVQQITLVYEIK